MNHLLGLEKARFLKPDRESELIQKSKSLRAFSGVGRKNIHGACVTRAGVKCETLRANNDVINATAL